ncbi:cytochrome C biogenesis protein [Fulvivirga sp. M361]|uniref:protein-disulfide reductase DsbD domain-containing protein n=1 Tax=Fulvivirga sp. M361 TaxID=2594266 RepID=UPI001179D651|nr:protein-disulfide reductase DsbD domain-containing protein [Fulvivirga sp. M361]TRX59962.1 cytochrome C biogenesis protein [Fulvivirga sp. M361]
MKKSNLIVVLTLLVAGTVKAQIHDPVKWSTSAKKVSDTEYELIATAHIEDGWHLYAQSVPDDGPRPTVFSFEGNSNYLKKGNTKEAEGHTVDDPIFEMRIKYFSEETAFKQRIKLKNDTPFKVNGVVEFMVCNDEMCLPPKEVDLTFEVK